MSLGNLCPAESPSPIDLRQSQQWCRRLARSHYENFLVASFLLPRQMRQPFYNIYAFCRTADDVADESPSPDQALKGLDRLQSRIDDLFAGNPDDSTFVPALADTVAQFGLSKQPFDDLLSAFRQDQRVFEYESTEQLLEYCSRSANPVGRLVLQLADSLDDSTSAMSDQICTGLQLANFWQDIARDFAIGRVYLPADRCGQFAVTTTMLSEKSTPAPLRELISALCDETESHFRRGLPLADLVPKWLANDVRLFAHGGLETLNAIRAIDYDVLRVRPVVSKFRQMTLVAKAAIGRLA